MGNGDRKTGEKKRGRKKEKRKVRRGEKCYKEEEERGR